MNNVMISQLKQVSAEMKVLMNQSKEGGQKFNKPEQDLFEQLSAEREELLSNIIFHGHFTTNSNVK